MVEKAEGGGGVAEGAVVVVTATAIVVVVVVVVGSAFPRMEMRMGSAVATEAEGRKGFEGRGLFVFRRGFRVIGWLGGRVLGRVETLS